MKKIPPCGEKRSKIATTWRKSSKKAFNDEKASPHGEINVATRPPFYSTIFVLQQMLYISWIFVLASHSTNIFLLFILHRTNWPIFAFPFSFAGGGGGQSPLAPHPLPPWTSACPPTPFHFACIVIDPPLISLAKHR